MQIPPGDHDYSRTKNNHGLLAHFTVFELTLYIESSTVLQLHNKDYK